jgi:MoxR-like ATPase
VVESLTVPRSVDELQQALATRHYVADRGLAVSIFLALRLKRPLFLEGEPGVGKTEVAKTLASALDTELIRLQCYEGLDVSHAVYEWNYTRQLLEIRLLEAAHELDRAGAVRHLFTEPFLIKRALLRALEPAGGRPPVLLIDEIDRADEEFEGYLLELLSDFQVTIPELGTIRASDPPVVIITSNRTRDVHDALKRRCLYHWVEHPDFEREVAIVRLRAPEAVERLAREVAAAVEAMRELDLYKPPGVAETIDWAQALARLGCGALDEDVVGVTLGSVLKYREDQERVRTHGLDELVRTAAARHG